MGTMNRAERRRRQKTDKVKSKAVKAIDVECTQADNQTVDLQQRMDVAIDRHQAGDLATAAGLYQDILKADPDQPVALHFLGVIAQQKGKPQTALEMSTKALAVRPDLLEAWINLGNAQKDLGQHETAAISFQKAISLKPDYAEAHYNLGVVLQELERPEDAVACYHEALRLAPGQAAVHNNLGNALRDLNRLDKAVAQFQEVLALRPNDANTYCNLGITYKHLNKPDDAIACFERALTFAPDRAEFHWNMAFSLLKQQQLERGWDAYTWGLKLDGARALSGPVPGAPWCGEPLEGKTLLVVAEQGVGDEIMFSGCLADLKRFAPGRVLLECDPRLVPLFRRSFSGPVIHGTQKDTGRTWTAAHGSVDFHVAMGSLPKYLRAKIDDFPDRESYMVADTVRAADWHDRLTALGPGLKIGISWRGGMPEFVHKRSVPLADWQELLSMDAVFINLQYGETAAELAELRESQGIEIHDWSDNDPLADLDNQAALISALDLVISIDNTTVHLAGALGTPVWAMIDPALNALWLQKDTDVTPFYRSVRLFQKDNGADWASVLDRVKDALRDRIG